VVNSEFEPIILSGGALLFGVFVPVCYKSQALIDASFSFRETAYHTVLRMNQRGTPIEVPQYFVLVILAASRPCKLSVRAFGRLDLENAGNALRCWYSFVQILLNATQKTHLMLSSAGSLL
ncbi:Odorant receptor 31, partial [Frankliniella occidentalis]